MEIVILDACLYLIIWSRGRGSEVTERTLWNESGWSEREKRRGGWQQLVMLCVRYWFRLVLLLIPALVVPKCRFASWPVCEALWRNHFKKSPGPSVKSSSRLLRPIFGKAWQLTLIFHFHPRRAQRFGGHGLKTARCGLSNAPAGGCWPRKLSSTPRIAIPSMESAWEPSRRALRSSSP